jgi:histidine triad (HIT) family protein
VYEDELCFAAVSQNPINRYHVMVIPREHYENFIDLPDDLASHLFLVAKKLSLAVRKSCNPVAIHHISDDDIQKKGYNLISHYKFHIIPRFENDKVKMEWDRYDLSLEERTKIAEEIKKQL